jgi:RHH-type proline utilization regulon transcriptional repressor/proline dehydrogenase/delta 1-pyrroline-5-carboxylate dehydrogenase
MEIEEDAPPEMHPVSSEGPLLSLIHDWENRLRWEKFGSCSQVLEKTVRAIHDFLHEYDAEFSREHDFFKLRGQDNIFRYLPVGHLVIRLHAEDSLFDVLARCAAAVVLELDYSISMEPGLDTPAVHFLHSREGRLFEARICEETDDALIKRLPDVDRLRYAAPDRVPMAVFEAAAKLGLFIAREPVMMHGRIELLRYLREQAVCVNYHRYGNLQERGLVLEGKIKPAQ